jgi:uncharacterized LabA/DUF88 family protein
LISQEATLTIEITTPSLPATLAAIVGTLLGVGVGIQQPLVTGAGLGLAGGCLVKSRRQESELNNSSELVAKIQKMGHSLDRLKEQVAQRDRQVEDFNIGVSVCQASNRSLEERIDQIEAISKDLNEAAKLQKTQSNLFVRAIQNLQQDNHKIQGSIAKVRQEISNIDRVDSTLPISIANVTAAEPDCGSKIPTTHLLVDGNAAHFVTKEIGKIYYQKLYELTKDARQVNCKIYLADTKKAAQNYFVAALEQIGFEVLRFPIAICGGVPKTKGDDVQIALDAARAQPGDRVILCAWDGDFVPVINDLKARGIDFTLVAYQPYLAKSLKQAADGNLIYLSDIEGIKLS